ncbi:MAG: hypothetical protein ABR91_07330 [Polaribacter sp. BACL8 MAG-120531-bin13]|jgi:hypothetical protein|nr:MAG: hypothetical protein ABR91_07330 [Polaribacter sp. BACL8 MAG-120531-bin13]MBT4840067.1 hypothetical protein [Flavobacteriaceae bacterium]NQV62657.1 hypothetical protein [Cryomorphaceae bacterium]MCO4853442.1 hypothetical protein [Flavobacteriaceae bacterium]MDA9928867.1 hypothetical protein [Flavobacteriaceae bacterium]|tara:strand:+ start:691 stop:1587 length:897 start_codon:yes stop_codon:yes gene_type:complete
MSLFTGFLFTHLMGWSQEIITYDRSDFDLKGPVKSCFVFTKYGQEQYQFNKTGQLVEAATVFGENDSETTYYKYEKAKLVERRVENYVNGVLDKTTSMANFYSYDSIPQLKIKEKIIGYDRTFVAQFNYRYDSIGQLTRVVRTNTQGRFITLISHQWDSLRTKKSTAYWLDSVPLKQIDSIFLKAGGTLSQLKTKEFDNGIPNALELRVFNKKGLEIELHSTIYIEKDALLVPKKASSVRTKYDSNNHPIEQIFERGVVRQTKKNLYQLDGSPFKNWIKKITTPDNTYTTRKIVYFEE